MTEETNPDPLPGNFPFTIWRKADGEILRSGTCTFQWGLANQIADADAEELFSGEELGVDTHQFDPATSLPFERVRLFTSDELRVAINRERERRLLSGKMFDGILVTGSPTDIMNLTSLALGAQLRLASGDTTTTTVFRDGGNNNHALTPQALLSIWSQATTYVSAVYTASWALKDAEIIPQDVTADRWWP
jgi:hypothetical protein